MSFWSKLFGKGSKPEPTYEIPTIQFDTRWVTRTVKDDLLTSITQADEVPDYMVDAVYQAALAMVTRGNDLHSFTTKLATFRVNALSKRNIRDLALHLSARSTSMINIERMLDAGFTEATWLYANAPCTGSEKQDALHKKTNGISFPIANGVILETKPTWPGIERGCKCSMKVVIKGFS